MTELIYSGTTMISANEQPHLGGNVKEGDPYTFCPGAWSYVIERFGVQSVMDLGSGIGNAASFFFKKNLPTIAVDGLPQNIQMALFPTICHDLTNGPVRTKVDLVHCQEVVEHIEEKYLDNLLDSLACGRVIMMTHALPGQGGHHHVNEKPVEYWAEHVCSRGYNLLIEDSNRIRNLAAKDGAVYVNRSGLLFHRS